jgi:hypothetical protein
MIDREAQKTDTFTGIEGINAYDVEIQENIGPFWIVPRTICHGVIWPSSPPAVCCFNRLVPLPVAGTHLLWTPYYRLRPIEKVVPNCTSWREALLPEMLRSKRNKFCVEQMSLEASETGPLHLPGH